jgi:hypothetical protein
MTVHPLSTFWQMDSVPSSNTFYAILEQKVSETHGADAMNTCTRCEQLAEKIRVNS